MTEENTFKSEKTEQLKSIDKRSQCEYLRAEITETITTLDQEQEHAYMEYAIDD